MVNVATPYTPSVTASTALERAVPTKVKTARIQAEPRKTEPRRSEQRDTFERTAAEARGKTDKQPKAEKAPKPPKAEKAPKADKTSKADKDKAALENFKFINDMGSEARKLKAELSTSEANATIDDQSTSENMNSKQFKLFSRSSKFSSHVLGKAFEHARKNGLGGDDDPRLSPEERTQLASLKDGLKRSLLRSKDSFLTAGERHQASQDVADAVIGLQDFANKKAADTIAIEGKKALEEAGKYFGGLFSKGEEKEIEKGKKELERSNNQDKSDKSQKFGPDLLKQELKKREDRERMEKSADALKAFSDKARAEADAFRDGFADSYRPTKVSRPPIDIVAFVPPPPVYTPGLIRGGGGPPTSPAPTLDPPLTPVVPVPTQTQPPQRLPELIA